MKSLSVVIPWKSGQVVRAHSAGKRTDDPVVIPWKSGQVVRVSLRQTPQAKHSRNPLEIRASGQRRQGGMGRVHRPS